MYLEKITNQIISAAIEVHRGLGPGLLESAYLKCLPYEFARRDLNVVMQQSLNISYKDMVIEAVYRLDFVINEKIVVETKSVERLERVHVAQMITYLKLGNYPVGLLINFNVELLKDGIRRITNNAVVPPSLLSSL